MTRLVHLNEVKFFAGVASKAACDPRLKTSAANGTSESAEVTCPRCREISATKQRRADLASAEIAGGPFAPCGGWPVRP